MLSTSSEVWQLGVPCVSVPHGWQIRNWSLLGVTAGANPTHEPDRQLAWGRAAGRRAIVPVDGPNAVAMGPWRHWGNARCWAGAVGGLGDGSRKGLTAVCRAAPGGRAGGLVVNVARPAGPIAGTRSRTSILGFGGCPWGETQHLGGAGSQPTAAHLVPARRRDAHSPRTRHGDRTLLGPKASTRRAITAPCSPCCPGR